MKYLLAILILCSTVSASVKNTGSTRRDSVAIWVVCLDSTGKPSTCDSFYVRVVNNSTNAVLFSDSGTATMTGLDSINGKSEYYYHRAVADIDGGGTDGEYILAVNAKKTAGSGWTTPNSRMFQIQNILYADSAIFQRLGVYNTTASTTTNDYAAVEFSSTGDSSFAFVVKNTGILGAKFKGSAFKLYSKTHSGILSIGGATGSPVSGGAYFLDSSASGSGTYSRSTQSGVASTFIEDAGNTSTTLGPTGGDITAGWITPSAMDADAIGSSELSDAAAREIASHILKDTTKRIGVKGGLGDSVLTPTPSVSASVTSLPDSVQSNIARHVWERTADTTYPAKSWGDTVGKTALNVVTYLKPIYDTVQLYDNWLRDSIHNAAIYARIAADSIQVYDNAGRFQAIVQQILDTIQTYDNASRFQANAQELLDTLKTYDNAGRFQTLVQEILDTLKLHDNWVAKEASVTKVRDSVSKLHFNGDSVVAIDPVRTVVLTTPPLVPGDTDELRANIVAAVGLTAARQAKIDSITGLAKTQDTIQDTLTAIHAKLNIVGDTANADITLDRLQATAANLIKVIDSVNAILDTLQNVNSALRVDTATSGGGGGGEVWTTAQRDSIIDRVLKVRDSVNAILDSLQNLSSTLRLAGSDLDTVYQTVLCNDTIGGDFLLTLADYRAQVKRKFGVEISNTTWMTDTVLNQLVREAIVTVNPIMRGYKTTKVVVSQFDSSDYPLDSLVGIASVLWHKDDTARSIPYLAREKWATLTTQNTYGQDDPYLERPQVYDYTDALISFFPVPTSDDTIKINGWSKIPNITVVSSVAQIPQKYRIAILKYVTFLVARAKQHPLIQTYLDEYKESLVFLAGQNVQVAR